MLLFLTDRGVSFSRDCQLYPDGLGLGSPDSSYRYDYLLLIMIRLQLAIHSQAVQVAATDQDGGQGTPDLQRPKLHQKHRRRRYTGAEEARSLLNLSSHKLAFAGQPGVFRNSVAWARVRRKGRSKFSKNAELPLLALLSVTHEGMEMSDYGGMHSSGSARGSRLQ